MPDRTDLELRKKVDRHADVEKYIISLFKERDKGSRLSKALELYNNHLAESLAFLETIGSQYDLAERREELSDMLMYSIAADAKKRDRRYDLDVVLRKIIPLLNEEKRLQWIFVIFRIYPAGIFVPNISSPESIPISCRFDQNFVATLNSCISAGNPVLLNGETGTGKELFAKTIHCLSNRRDHPFVAVNMSGLSANLVESELFGHVEGAFTGAIKKRSGCFEEAGEGTLFLDEIGDMPIEAQTRLLRVLSDNTFVPVGGNQRRALKFQARVICATNKDIPSLIEQGQFRSDLFYRINTFQLTLPTLRQVLKNMSHEPFEDDNRKDFFERIADDVADEISYPYSIGISDGEAFEKLSAYSYPGNYRDLYNVMIRAVCLLKPKGRSVIHSNDIVFSVNSPKCSSDNIGIDVNPLSFQDIARKADLYADALFRNKIESLLQKHKGIICDAAAEAGFGSSKNAITKFNKLAKKYGMKWQDFRK